MEYTLLTAEHLGITQIPVLDSSLLNLSQYVRLLMQSWRQGTVGCKDRSEVSFSNRKPWKQKGTGRARAGTLRSPLWRKGGVIFGPQPRVRTLSLNRKVRQQVLHDILMQKLAQQHIVIVDWEPTEVPSTAAFNVALKKAGLHGKKSLLFVDMHDVITHASAGNIPGLRMITFDQANAYVLVHGTYWVVLRKDIDLFKQMVSAWI